MSDTGEAEAPKKRERRRSRTASVPGLDEDELTELHLRHGKARQHAESKNVQVMIRVRPFNKAEWSLGDQSKNPPVQSVLYTDGTVSSLLDPHANYEVREAYRFDKCFWSVPEAQSQSVGADVTFADQQTIFDEIGLPAVDSVLSGRNCCTLAYGQTSSGKTYTMIGTKEDPGIIPRVIDVLFDRIQNAPRHMEYAVTASFLEIYNEKVKDLLAAAEAHTLARDVAFTDRRVRQHPTLGTYVEGLKRSVIKTPQESDLVIKAGTTYRATAATKLNDTSSRSHAILQLHVQVTDKHQGLVRSGLLNLVDLAGSERVHMSGATGSTFDEAKNINLSLLTLRRVIDSLIETSSTTIRPGTGSGATTPLRRRSSARAIVVVPFRDSMLTWVLSNTLGGNCLTTMIGTVSPHLRNFEDTHNTLRYCNKARAITCNVKVNEQKCAVVVESILEEMNYLRRKLMEQLDTQAAQSNTFDDDRERFEEERNEAQRRAASMRRRGTLIQMQAEETRAELQRLQRELDALTKVSAEARQLEQERLALEASKRENAARIKKERDARRRSEREVRAARAAATALERQHAEDILTESKLRAQKQHVQQKEIALVFRRATLAAKEQRELDKLDAERDELLMKITEAEARRDDCDRKTAAVLDTVSTLRDVVAMRTEQQASMNAAIEKAHARKGQALASLNESIRVGGIAIEAATEEDAAVRTELEKWRADLEKLRSDEPHNGPVFVEDELSNVADNLGNRQAQSGADVMIKENDTTEDVDDVVKPRPSEALESMMASDASIGRGRRALARGVPPRAVIAALQSAVDSLCCSSPGPSSPAHRDACDATIDATEAQLAKDASEREQVEEELESWARKMREFTFEIDVLSEQVRHVTDVTTSHKQMATEAQSEIVDAQSKLGKLTRERERLESAHASLASYLDRRVAPIEGHDDFTGTAVFSPTLTTTTTASPSVTFARSATATSITTTTSVTAAAEPQQVTPLSPGLITTSSSSSTVDPATSAMARAGQPRASKGSCAKNRGGDSSSTHSKLGGEKNGTAAVSTATAAANAFRRQNTAPSMPSSDAAPPAIASLMARLGPSGRCGSPQLVVSHGSISVVRRSTSLTRSRSHSRSLSRSRSAEPRGGGSGGGARASSVRQYQKTADHVQAFSRSGPHGSSRSDRDRPSSPLGDEVLLSHSGHHLDHPNDHHHDLNDHHHESDHHRDHVDGEVDAGSELQHHSTISSAGLAAGQSPQPANPNGGYGLRPTSHSQTPQAQFSRTYSASPTPMALQYGTPQAQTLARTPGAGDRSRAGQIGATTPGVRGASAGARSTSQAQRFSRTASAVPPTPSGAIKASNTATPHQRDSSSVSKSLYSTAQGQPSAGRGAGSSAQRSHVRTPSQSASTPSRNTGVLRGRQDHTATPKRRVTSCHRENAGAEEGDDDAAFSPSAVSATAKKRAPSAENQNGPLDPQTSSAAAAAKSKTVVPTLALSALSPAQHRGTDGNVKTPMTTKSATPKTAAGAPRTPSNTAGSRLARPQPPSNLGLRPTNTTTAVGGGTPTCNATTPKQASSSGPSGSTSTMPLGGGGGSTPTCNATTPKQASNSGGPSGSTSTMPLGGSVGGGGRGGGGGAGNVFVRTASESRPRVGSSPAGAQRMARQDIAVTRTVSGPNGVHGPVASVLSPSVKNRSISSGVTRGVLPATGSSAQKQPASTSSASAAAMTPPLKARAVCGAAGLASPSTIPSALRSPGVGRR